MKPEKLSCKSALHANQLDQLCGKEAECLKSDFRKCQFFRLSVGIAHEIRNPISVINIYLDILKENLNDSGKDSDITEFISEIESAASRIETIVKTAMDFSRPHISRLARTDINRTPELRSVTLSEMETDVHADHVCGKEAECLKSDFRKCQFFRLSADVAHEIRNPISVINIYLDILKENLDDSGKGSDITEFISEIESATSRIETIVKTVMDFSRPHVPRLARTDINRCVRKASEFALPEEEIIMETVLHEDMPECFLDARSVLQVLINLITNAAEAMKNTAHRKIMIRSRHDNDSVVITVSDSGPGVSQDDRDKIFAPFFTTKHRGLGIGLSISSGIIKDHGGRMDVSDSIMGGAEFRITLPCSQLLPDIGVQT